MSDTRRPAQLQSFTLAGSGAGPGDTTIILSSFTDIDGNLVAMSDLGTKAYGTTEPGSSTQEEQISFTGVVQNGNGSATLTGVSNVGFLYPYTETSGLTKSHAGGVTFVLSNTSGFYGDFTNKHNEEIIDQVWTFDATPVISNDPIANTDAANKEYVDGVATAGAPNGNTTTKGIYQSATVAQQGTATATGSTGARLVPENANLIKTSAGTGSENKLVVLNAVGAFDETTLYESGTCGVSITAGQAIRIGGDGKLYLTDPTDVNLSQLYNSFIGVAVDAGGTDQTIRYALPGRIVSGLASFASNDSAPVYLGNTAGSLSLTPGDVSIQIGWVISDTTMLIISPVNKEVQDLVQQGYAAGTAGETITTGQALYLKASDSKLYKTDADADASTYAFVGIAQNDASADGVLTYSKPGGIAKGLTGLTAGTMYYLSGTAGALATTGGARSARVGLALTTTTLLVLQPSFVVTGAMSITSTGDTVVTTGFYPAHIELVATTGTGSGGFSMGDDGNKCIYLNNATWTSDATKAVKLVNVTPTTLEIGTISAKSATGFTYNSSTHPGGVTTTINYTAYSC